MLKKQLLSLAAILFLAIPALAQDPCDNPYPDTCRYSNVCCSIDWSRCPWNYNGMDITYIVNYFHGGPIPLAPISKFDANCNCSINGIDVIYMVNFIKGVGPAPECCFYQCMFHPQLGQIGNYVWYDLNGDGIQDNGEWGIPGVNVTLTDCSNPPNILQSEITNENGYYKFDTLNTGDYKVQFEPPPNHAFTQMNQGSNDFRDSDVNPATGYTDTIHVALNIADYDWDAGIYRTSGLCTIGDKAWLDMNVNGIQDEDEPGITGIPFALYAGSDMTHAVAWDTSDTEGNYLFEGLPPGTYSLRFLFPDDFRMTAPNQGDDDSIDSDFYPDGQGTGPFEITEGMEALNWDLGLYWPYMEANIGDKIWNDINHDGIQDTGEPGLAGATINLLSPDDSLFVRSSLSDSLGQYLIERLWGGRYYLQVILPDGYLFSPSNAVENDSIDSDINPESGFSEQFYLNTDEPDITRDAGAYAYIDSGCTHPISFWLGNDGHRSYPDSITQYLPVWLGTPESEKALAVTSAETAHNVFTLITYGNPLNGITTLYSELLAAKLNIAAGAMDNDIAGSISDIDGFLATHDWHDWSGLSFEEKRVIAQWVMILDAYNLGTIGPGACGE
jgi:hypothetical protein